MAQLDALFQESVDLFNGGMVFGLGVYGGEFIFKHEGLSAKEPSYLLK